MATKDFKRKLSAILSADVAGYSRLMGEDEAATVEAITTYREIMGGLIRQHRGGVVDSPGDNLLAEFGSVVDAVQCAVAVQKEFQARNAELPENRRMEFRIGINLGDVIEEEDRIYGDGVNIAARLESLADPGGICVSKTAFDHIETKLPLGYEYLGDQTVKNIARPVGAYRVLMDPRVTVAGEVEKEKAVPVGRRKAILAGGLALILVVIAGLIWNFYFRPPPMEPASVEKMAFPLPDKPSIAVLPFANIGGDPDQEYFSDGLTEEIITALSKVHKMLVIARNSTFTYKGKPVKVKQVAEELGVQYVLEGSVRKAGDRVRITAQLIDALTGHHLWAERYDRDMKDIFALQDEITKKITVALQVKLTQGEEARIWAKGTDNLEAYEKWLQARDYYLRGTKEGYAMARQLCEEAIALDPKYPMPYVYMGMAHVYEARLGYSKSRRRSMERGFDLVQKALELDDTLGFAHSGLAYIYRQKRQYEKAITEAERAIALNPNSAIAYWFLAACLYPTGRPDEAIASVKKAMRLNPVSPWFYFYLLGQANWVMGQYEEAIAAYKQAIQRKPDNLYSHISLTASYSLLGREEEARAETAEVLRIHRKFSVDHIAKTLPFKNKADTERYVEALRKAGLPDKPPLPLSDKPSIAVLPFANISGDPKEDYLSDGITEQIITALSKTPKLFVIARNSVFTYKGKPVKVQQVSKDLGVRYVLEGSVQKSGDRIRITAQLIDAKTGNHLWAEKYDRELKHIFALQDEITLKILKAMRVTLLEGERARASAGTTDNLEAYLKYLKAVDYFRRYTKEDNVRAREVFQEAIALDPEYSTAYALLGWTHMHDARYAWSKSRRESTERALELAKKALSLDDTCEMALFMISYIHRQKGKYDQSIAGIERVIELNPNSADAYAHLAGRLYAVGRGQEGIASMQKAMRLNPISPWFYYYWLGMNHWVMGQYEETIAACKKVLDRHPTNLVAHVVLTTCYSILGREEEARAQAAEVLKNDPKFSVAKYAKRLPFKDKTFTERYVEGLRKAGLK